MTLHAEEEMANDELTVFDVESAILTGRIKERQKDRDTGEWKYLITGTSLAGDNVAVIAKLSVTEKLVIITVFTE